MTQCFTLRRAVCGDEPQIMALIREAAGWLATLGTDQWQGLEDRRRSRVLMDIDAGAVWLVEDGDAVVATITVDEWADADFWCHTDRVRDALYAHRMAVARSHKGRGLGSALLDWASELAEQQHRAWVRFDAWSTNDALHRYYKGLGFEMVRNVPVEGRGSGALFQRPAVERGGGPRLVGGAAHSGSTPPSR